MLVIRLQRTGRRNLATYRIVVADKARAVKGKSLAIVGHYLPQRTPATLTFDAPRIGAWVSKGAEPSDTVARLLKREGVKDMDRFIVRYTKRKPKGEAPESGAAVPAPAPAAQAQAPVEKPAGDTDEKKE